MERFLKEAVEMITGIMKRTIQAAALTALAVIIVSCNPSKKYEEEEKSLIADYVAENNITVSPDAKGLYYMAVSYTHLTLPTTPYV